MKSRSSVIAAGLAATIAFAGVLGASTPAYAVEQADVDAAAARLSELGAQLTEIQSSLDSASSELAQTSVDLANKQDEVNDTQAKLDTKRSELSDIMRSNYKLGASSVLDFILGSTSINDLVSRVCYMDKISEQRAEVINTVKSMEEQLKSEQAELESKQSEQTEKVVSLQSQAEDYDSRVSEASSYYNSLDSELQAQVAAAAEAEQNAAAAAAVTAVQQATEQQQEAQQAAQDTSSETQEQLKKQEESEVPDNSSSNANKNSDSEASRSDNNSKSDNSPKSETTSKTESSSSGSSYGGGGVGTALAQIGKPYAYGATGPDSFDCSGLVCYSYGYARGRTTYAMIDSLQASGNWKTDISQLSYGDLVFTSAGHVGIYLGNNTMVHAPKPGSSVCTTTVWSFYGGGSY